MATRADAVTDYAVSCLTDFSAMKFAAPGLNDDASADLFFTAPWFENLALNGTDPGGRKMLVLVRHRLNGAALCVPVQVRAGVQAAVYGQAVSSLSNYYSSLYGPVGEQALCSVSACRALLQHLRRQGGVIELQPLDAQSAFFAHMKKALALEGWWADDYFCFGNWHLEVAGRAYDTYAKTIPSRLRNTIKRGQKKLDSAGSWTLQVVADPGVELDQAIADWQTIYDKSWKVPEPYPRFVPELCRMAARHGWLRLGVVRVEGIPVAAQIWLLRNGYAQIFKLAYDEEYKRYSAGSVLSAEMMRRAIDVDGVVDVDYLTGDDGYKADWMSHRRERRGIVAFHPGSVQGLCSAARHFGGRWLRRWRKTNGSGNPAIAVPAESASADA